MSFMFNHIAINRLFTGLKSLFIVAGLFIRNTELSLLVYALGLTAYLAHRAMAYCYDDIVAESFFPRLPVKALFRLSRTKLHKLPKLARVALFGLVALVVFCCLPGTLRHTIMPTAGGFTPDNLGAYTLGAFQYFAALSLAYVSWRGLFPGLYDYACEMMESKLLESLTAELLTRLPASFLPGQEDTIQLQLAALAERRKIATFQFTARCARFAFSVLPFFIFFFAANAALASALTVVPAAVIGR
jgi:hypothetical protein